MRKVMRSVLKSGVFVVILCLPEFLPGQQSAGVIHPLALGFVFDSGTLKPIVGIPGASLLGKGVETGLEFAGASVSPGQNYALLPGGKDREVTLLRLPASGGPASAIEGAIAAPDLLVLSPSGDAAVLYRASDGLFQVLAGLPDSPRILREIPYGTLGGVVTCAAVADGGEAILAAVSDKIVLFPADGIPRPLPLEGPVSAITFRPRTHDAIVAGQRNNRVSLILHAAEVPEIQILAGPEDGIVNPLAVAFSLDGRQAFAANSGGDLVQLDLTGAPPQPLSCRCRITGLHRLAGNSVFRLTDPSDGPLLVFDGDARPARIVFVPAASAGGVDDVR